MSTKLAIAYAVVGIVMISDAIDSAKYRKEVFPMMAPDVENLRVIREKTKKRLIRQAVFVGAAAVAGFTVNRELARMATK